MTIKSLSTDVSAWEIVIGHTWSRDYGRTRKYWGCAINGKKKMLHRVIWEALVGRIPNGMDIDHIDRDTNNNTLSNLRCVSRSDNQANRGRQSNNTSGFTGVSFAHGNKKWLAQMKKRGRYIYLGYHACKEDAARAVNRGYAVHFPGVTQPNKIS